MALLLLSSLAGALLLWNLAASGHRPDRPDIGVAAGDENPAGQGPTPLRTRLLGALGLALQLPLLITVPLMLVNGQLPGVADKVTGVAMLVLPAVFAVLGLRLLLGRIAPRR